MEEKRLIWLNGNQNQAGYLAFGIEAELNLREEEGGFEEARVFLEKNKGEHVFGWFGYDLKNDIENLSSVHPSWVKAPIIFLMKPRHLARVEQGKLEVLKGDLEALQAVYNRLVEHNAPASAKVSITPVIDEKTYIDKVRKIKKHIQLGDIYEANFCYEYRGKGVIDPLAVYHKLNASTQAPFSVFAQVGNLSILSASPERFVKKTGTKLFTQPIKGTIRRGENDLEDQQLIDQLRKNPKDRSENIMIVDLVRNDLARIADAASVKVEELCEIYTFENIHQMISTVSAQVTDKHPIDILKALFPMGSMTGAPKIRAMKIIEEQEVSKRGLYSGCIGYFTPSGDFDFNVVIRTILYDKKTRKLSLSVGGAITDLSTPEGEYEETLLKAKAMREALNP